MSEKSRKIAWRVWIKMLKFAVPKENKEIEEISPHIV